ncbi:uncharacterized protein LOC135823196 [Sycon ciliatum]|uniref:uncharacterized protein LOC135823196 n=1 Tax=Sycon ciliatum TaxID=27933 RepID=UPI0031F61A39
MTMSMTLRNIIRIARFNPHISVLSGTKPLVSDSFHPRLTWSRRGIPFAPAASFSSTVRHLNFSADTMTSPATTPEEVLDFWFSLAPEEHYKTNPELDEKIRAKFSQLHEQACAGQLNSWKDGAESCLALTIVLDQFSRNMFRGTGDMYGNDVSALAIAKHAVDKDYHKCLPFSRAGFFFLPFMHSEELNDQHQCVQLYRDVCDSEGTPSAASFGLEYAIKHRDIVERFGKFPHRNALLGRESTSEEVEFLTQPGSSF